MPKTKTSKKIDFTLSLLPLFLFIYLSNHLSLASCLLLTFLFSLKKINKVLLFSILHMGLEENLQFCNICAEANSIGLCAWYWSIQSQFWFKNWHKFLVTKLYYHAVFLQQGMLVIQMYKIMTSSVLWHRLLCPLFHFTIK